MKLPALAFAALVIASILSQGAHAATLSGTVRCEDGCMIDGATVSLAGPVNRTVRSDAGLYGFADIPAGNYTLAVEMEGYDGWSSQVAVDGDETVDVVLVQSEEPWWPWALFTVVSVVAISAVAYAAIGLLRRRDA